MNWLNIDEEVFESSICELIHYYMRNIDGRPICRNIDSGYMFSVVEKGNLTDEIIWDAQVMAEERGDTLGYMILTTLRGIDFEKREELFDNNWPLNLA